MARAKPCAVIVDTTSMVLSRDEKVVMNIDDVDKLGRFLIEKVCYQLWLSNITVC